MTLPALVPRLRHLRPCLGGRLRQRFAVLRPARRPATWLPPRPPSTNTKPKINPVNVRDYSHAQANYRRFAISRIGKQDRLATTVIEKVDIIVDRLTERQDGLELFEAKCDLRILTRFSDLKRREVLTANDVLCHQNHERG